MPRKKRSGQSPARVPGLSEQAAGGSRLHGPEGAMAGSFPHGPSMPSSAKEAIVRNMQEMFSHLDPEVIYIVLSECDFKAENAMDSLLELSVAAEVAGPQPPDVSGFELTAAALLAPHHSEPSAHPDHPKPFRSSLSPLTVELDLLIDEGLKTLTSQPMDKKNLSKGVVADYAGPLSSFPTPPVVQQALPELLQSSLDPGARGISDKRQSPGGIALGEQTPGTSSPLDKLSSWEGEDFKAKESVLDFTHLISETASTKPNPPLDLAASGRPSAFQVYKKQDQPRAASESPGAMSPGEMAGGTRSKKGAQSWQPPGNMSPSWNLEAPAFLPQIRGNQPTFITPVAILPSPWDTQTRPVSHWMTHQPASQTPHKLTATFPQSWALPPPPAQGFIPHSRLRLEGKVLVLLRGAPGSGKSTLARAMLEQNPGGVVLSTDDYFNRHGEYRYDPSVLGEAHEWNHKRAKEAFENGANPIIIDNTNMHGWEMKAYVAQALKHHYKVLFREPDTWWKRKPRELVRRTKHSVPLEKIRHMLEYYERFVSVQSIMDSHPVHQESRPLQPRPSGTPCPDLVGQHGLAQATEKSRPPVLSSLPDVSSIRLSEDMGMAEHGIQNTPETLNNLTCEDEQENCVVLNKDDDEMDLLELDTELDAHLELHPLSTDQGIPDCIVESVLNEDLYCDEVPVAFSESIGQRVKRERQRRKPDHDGPEPVDLVKDTNQSGREEEGVEEHGRKEVEGAVGGGKQRPELLDFVGDWPSEGQMEQRQVRRRERQEDKKVEGGSSAEAENNAKEKKARRGLEVTELQKLLDLIQTGVDLTHTGSSPEFILSSSSAEKSDDEEGEGGRSQGSHGNGFKRKQREQSSNRGDSGRSDLPDCVLDWTEDNSSLSREPSQSVIAESGGEEIVENVDSRTREGTAGGSESNDHNACFSYLVVDSLITSEIVGEKVSRDEEGLNFRGEPGSGADAGLSDKDQHCTDADSHPKFSSEADGIDVVFSHSPLGEGSVESESGSFSGGSQEHKRRHSRRSGKQCKLALTFTQNCPLSSLQSPQATGQNRNVGEGSTDLNINSNINININSPPDCDLSLDLQTTPDPCPILNPVPNTGSQLPSHSLNAMVETGCYTQTEPQDFALLWRVCLQNTDDTVATLGDFSSDIAILPTDPFRFLPAMSGSVSAEAAAHPSATSEVPYRMVHEKGTQVEEKELGVARSRVEDMRILSRHFKLVSFDTLEDLYDKCHQDLDWTTNLLLDSGERFFREDVEGGEGGLEEDSHNTSALKVDASESAVHIEVSSNADCPQAGPAFGVKMCEELATGEGSSQAVTTASESGDGVCTNPGSTGVGVENMSASNTQDISEKVTGGIEGALSQVGSTNEDRPDERSHSVQLPQPLLGLQKAVEEEGALKTKNKSTPKAVGGRLDDGRLFEDLRVKYGVEEVSDIDDATLLLLAELEEMDKREGDQMSEEVKSRRDFQERSSSNLVIQSLELNLPTELALQLTELFGPVGIDPGACSGADRAVQMDLHLAKLLHQKWKDTIKERQRQVALSYHLLQESSVHWGDAASTRTSSADFLIDADGFASLVNQLDAQDELPFMDHWSVYRPCVSLRDIMSEEQVRQQNLEKTRQSRADLDRRDGATLMKENQLYSLFPTIDRHFLQDIFRDHNYSLRETELFLHSLLDEGPVKTVVAPETPRTEPPRTPSKERDKRQNRSEPAVPQYQEMEDPEYEDFRAEARLQKSRQLENLAKAAEAFKQGRKDVASFYAQQGHLHSQRMHEANHRAAIQIFERVNSSLLPKNILDLHGLHVDEALQHLERVLHDKITEYQQGLCRPQLSVITGRGNHSQGGVARIRPAVIDYLTNKHYRFNEPTQGLVLVSLN